MTDHPDDKLGEDPDKLCDILRRANEFLADPALRRMFGDLMKRRPLGSGLDLGEVEPSPAASSSGLNREKDVTSLGLSIPPAALRLILDTAAERKYPYSTSRIDPSSLFAEATSEQMPLVVIVRSDRLYISSAELKDPEHVQADLQICSVSFDPESGGIRSVYQNVSNALFRVFLARFPSCKFTEELRRATGVGDPTGEDAGVFDRMVEEARETERLRDEILSLSGDERITGVLMENEGNTSAIHSVFQGEYAVASSDKVRWLATHGAADCFIVGVCPHDTEKRSLSPEMKKGSLTHIDAATDEVRTLEAMKSELQLKAQEDKNMRYLVVLSGGSQGSLKNVVKAYKIIKQWQDEGLPIDIMIGDVFGSGSEGLAIDLENATFSRFIPMPKDSGDAQLKSLMTMVGAYQGRKTARRNNP